MLSKFIKQINENDVSLRLDDAHCSIYIRNTNKKANKKEKKRKITTDFVLGRWLLSTCKSSRLGKFNPKRRFRL